MSRNNILLISFCRTRSSNETIKCFLTLAAVLTSIWEFLLFSFHNFSAKFHKSSPILVSKSLVSRVKARILMSYRDCFPRCPFVRLSVISDLSANFIISLFYSSENSSRQIHSGHAPEEWTRTYLDFLVTIAINLKRRLIFRENLYLTNPCIEVISYNSHQWQKRRWTFQLKKTFGRLRAL